MAHTNDYPQAFIDGLKADELALIDSFRAADLLDIPHRYLMRLVKARSIPCYALPGGLFKFDRCELGLWLRSMRQSVDVGQESQASG